MEILRHKKTKKRELEIPVYMRLSGSVKDQQSTLQGTVLLPYGGSGLDIGNLKNQIDFASVFNSGSRYDVIHVLSLGDSDKIGVGGA